MATVPNWLIIFIVVENMSSETPRVLSIQSHAVHGYIGNKCAVFPMQLLGFEVDSINTVQFSTHGAYDYRCKGSVLDSEDIAQLVTGLQLNHVDHYTHLITGYHMSGDTVKQIAEIVRKLRQRNPDLIYLCDPVMGDNGLLYAPEDVLPVYRDMIPLADIITPNQFEAELITGLKIRDLDGALTAINAFHSKGVKTVVLSSVDLDDDNIIAIASSKGECYSIVIPKINATFVGTGDVFTALFLSWYYKSNNDLKLALENSIATLQHIVKDTYQKARDKHPTGKVPPSVMELRIIQNKTAIESPVVEKTATRINAVSQNLIE